MRGVLILVAASIATAALGATQRPSVVIGSKAFTESVILGDIATDLARQAGAGTAQRRELGGTRVLWDALRHADIDIYAEYTGTLAREIFSGRGVADSRPALAAALAGEGIVLGPPLGFADGYALAMRAERAGTLGIESLDDLRRHPQLVLGFSNEFMARGDGWPGLRRTYGLPQTDVRGMAHELAYRAIASGAIDVTDVYTTDPNIRAYRLALLRDDRGFFPSYAAVFLWRADLAARAPQVVAALQGFRDRIDTGAMRRMNAAVQLDGVDDRAVAADFLGLAPAAASADSLWSGLALRIRQHLFLVAASLAAAIACAIPLGVVAARRRVLGQVILAAAGMLQTIPSLALLVLMIPVLGIGGPPALLALFLYSLLPIVRNTHQGLVNIDSALSDSARALGLPPLARLRLVELPLALPSILAGIKTSAVINVGTATLAALIGAGGLGQPILTGIRLNSMPMILEGAIPAVLLALVVQGAFEMLERALVPRGMRRRRSHRAG
ncbi:MAG: ABC transporter permease subunit [Gammaproteobacteria bacterium]|nr:ABC transporter permease subunit [Gammaproteobacteria bacterium]